MWPVEPPLSEADFDFEIWLLQEQNEKAMTGWEEAICRSHFIQLTGT